MLKVNNKNTGTRREICLTLKTAASVDFNVLTFDIFSADFEQIEHLILEILLLHFNR